MIKKHKKLFIALLSVIIFVLCTLSVAFSHDLFTTLPSSLAITTHTKNAPLLVAHRGLSSLYPENSVPAIEGAVAHGFAACEFDIHTTKDGRWVVIHDDTVDAMTDATGDVDSFTFKEIRKLTLDSGSRIELYDNLKIPTLEEVLDVCKKIDITPFIEIKKCDVKYLPSLVEMIESYGLSEKCILISFEREYLEKYRELDSEAEIMLLKGTPSKEDVDWCLEYGAGLDLGYYNIYKISDTLKYAKENGVKLGAWTVDNTAYADVLVLLGIEVITTNKILP